MISKIDKKAYDKIHALMGYRGFDSAVAKEISFLAVESVLSPGLDFMRDHRGLRRALDGASRAVGSEEAGPGDYAEAEKAVAYAIKMIDGLAAAQKGVVLIRGGEVCCAEPDVEAAMAAVDTVCGEAGEWTEIGRLEAEDPQCSGTVFMAVEIPLLPWPWAWEAPDAERVIDIGRTLGLWLRSEAERKPTP